MKMSSRHLRPDLRLRCCCIAAFVLALCISHLSATFLNTNPETSIIVEYPLLSKKILNHQHNTNNETILEKSNDLGPEATKLSDNSIEDYSWSPSSPVKSKNIVDSSCQFNKIVRQINTNPQVNRTENAFICTRINETNFEDIFANIRRKYATDTQIHHYQFTSSYSNIVFTVLNLTCSHFDCSNLTVLNISGQPITDHLNLTRWVRSWPSLDVMDLRNTSIESIEKLLMNINHSSITQMNLDYNNISSLNLTFLNQRMPNLRDFSAVNNVISDIYCNNVITCTSQFRTLRLAGNAINCNKSQSWFMRHILNHSSKFPDNHLINCSTPENFINMTWNQRISVLDTRLCDDCDCRSLKKSLNALSVDCNSRNLTALPDVLPPNTKVLNLTNNRIDSLGLPHNSKNWENVTYVYLENNIISNFPPPPLERNTEYMRNLAALDIRRNRFRKFPTHLFEQFINLDQVHLSNNPWLCDCESTFAFQEWLQRQFHKVGDKEEIRCGSSGSEVNGFKSKNLEQRLSSRVIYRLSKSELCPPDGLDEPWDWLDAVNWGLGILIILILAKLILDYIYQHKTKRLPHFFRLNF